MTTLKKKGIIFMILFVLSVTPLISLKAQAKAIYTKDATINAAVEIVLGRCTKEGMTRKQKLRAAYVYLVKHMHYTHGRGSVKIKVHRKQVKAMRVQTRAMKKEKKVHFSSRFRSRYRHLLTMSGTCYDMSAVFCIIANHLGYRAGLCSGRYVRSNGSSCEHWWNYVVINGSRRYFDVQAANAMKRNKWAYYCKKRSSGVWRRHHRG